LNIFDLFIFLIFFFSDFYKFFFGLAEYNYLKYSHNKYIYSFLRFFFPSLYSVKLENSPYIRRDLILLRVFFDDAILLFIKKFSIIEVSYKLIFSFLLYIYRNLFVDFYFNIYFFFKLRIFFFNKLYELHHLLIGVIIDYRIYRYRKMIK
jgi:hypothetical protein